MNLKKRGPNSRQDPPVPLKLIQDHPRNVQSLADTRPNGLIKPLPLVPAPSPIARGASKALPPKPLPEIPGPSDFDHLEVNYRYTLYWMAGFAVWFVLIVVLLPIITEKDAMPGFNRFLRRGAASTFGLKSKE
ncbi:hypothetical protein BS50DRAFT_358987 [Corynespora cassiicola Philippines]|uniref:Uncharacterized protein n=1 Tax=Corynespora cassiicola Philippines TaxID=1448308 RepID=A0A2T2NRW4_CORCC|nr:hypothetical protein BS50DRAFT_358987 [Corynespora cassiicola Philippines]